MNKGNMNAVVNYHSVGAPEKYGNVSPKRLDRDLKLFDTEFEIVDFRAEDLFSTGENRKIAITFDDGYSNFYTNSYPIIKKHEVPVTVFITADFIGDKNVEQIRQAHSISSNNSNIMMGIDQIQELISDGLVTIGNHTWSHPDLTQQNRNSLTHEIEKAQEHLEDLFDITVDRFSYPYGRYDDRALSLVRDSHSIGGCSRQDLVSSNVNPYLVPRLNGHKDFEVLKLELTKLGQDIRSVYSSLSNLTS
jgi:peptidoglycan/xylan/chitin deacetylase (PgdA/CDA1 family)